jgi:hypothetical protein
MGNRGEFWGFARRAKRENAESRAEFGDLGCCAEWFARRTDLRPSRFALHQDAMRDDAASGF